MKITYEKKGEDPTTIDIGNFRTTILTRDRRHVACRVGLVENTDGSLTILIDRGSPEIHVKMRR